MTTVKNGMCNLTDRRDGVTFAGIARIPGNYWFIIVRPLFLKHIDSDNRSIMNILNGQKIEAASSGTAVRLWTCRMSLAITSTTVNTMKTRTYGMPSSDVVKNQDRLSCAPVKYARNRYYGNLVVRGNLILLHTDILNLIRAASCGGNK